MPRRVHVDAVRAGLIHLDAVQAHHLRNVLRLETGQNVQVFDSQGATGDAVIQTCDDSQVTLRVENVRISSQATELIVASAVPKGDRADWLIEKLSELGVARFIPLQTARSVVHPAGRSKFERWERIAIESAKQCRRAGVMQIGELTPLPKLLPPSPVNSWEAYLLLSTARNAKPLIDVAPGAASCASICLLIGPEGGWSDDELNLMRHLTHVSLTATILRVETAAITAAAVVSCFLQRPIS